jgi:hypothetical protein
VKERFVWWNGLCGGTVCVERFVWNSLCGGTVCVVERFVWNGLRGTVRVERFVGNGLCGTVHPVRAAVPGRAEAGAHPPGREELLLKSLCFGGGAWRAKSLHFLSGAVAQERRVHLSLSGSLPLPGH